MKMFISDIKELIAKLFASELIDKTSSEQLAIINFYSKILNLLEDCMQETKDEEKDVKMFDSNEFEDIVKKFTGDKLHLYVNSKYPNITYNNIPNCCRSCSKHPSNGGDGICHCTAPLFENPPIKWWNQGPNDYPSGMQPYCGNTGNSPKKWNYTSSNIYKGDL